MQQRFRVGAASALVLLMTACAAVMPADREEARPQDARVFTPLDESTFAALPDAAPTHRWSGALNGASYRIEVPATGWNGQLLMWAHGYVSPEDPKQRPATPLMRRQLLAKGYAWAASSYSKNGYDVRAGVEDTNALALAFTQIAAERGQALPAPRRLFISGISMGGHIAGAAVERETLATARHRVRYAAALPMCGVMGDSALYDYFGAYGLAAAQGAGLPAASFPMKDFTAVSSAIQDTHGATFPAALTPQGERLKAIAMNLTGGARPFFDEGFAHVGMQKTVWGTFSGDGTSGGILTKSIVDTRTTVYRWTDPSQSPTPAEAWFNAGIARAVPVADANRPRRDGLRWMPLLKGEFDVPVLTLHTLGDLFVPFHMEQVYRRRAIAQGTDGRLVQRAIRDVNHCAFTAAEAAEAFDDLVAWTDGGPRPAGDDVMTPAIIAAPDYGCRFTRNAASAQDIAKAEVRAEHQARYPACPKP
ncbi:MAG: alpha/beta hydrolase [Microbacteriaceae bacterium]|nr:alpha/beta hydrolase [Burkholderiaceae bacterium]